MTDKQLSDWLAAAAQALPRARASKVRKALSAVKGGGRDACWEIGVTAVTTCAEGSLIVRRRESAGGRAVEFDASLRRDTLTPRATRPETAVAFDPAALGEAAAFLSDFAALCPVSCMLVEKDSSRWGLRLAHPLPWPGFARLSVAEPFAGDGTRLAYLLGERRVTEVWFDGGSLCVFLAATGES